MRCGGRAHAEQRAGSSPQGGGRRRTVQDGAAILHPPVAAPGGRAPRSGGHAAQICGSARNPRRDARRPAGCGKCKQWGSNSLPDDLAIDHQHAADGQPALEHAAASLEAQNSVGQRTLSLNTHPTAAHSPGAAPLPQRTSLMASSRNLRSSSVGSPLRSELVVPIAADGATRQRTPRAVAFQPKQTGTSAQLGARGMSVSRPRKSVRRFFTRIQAFTEPPATRLQQRVLRPVVRDTLAAHYGSVALDGDPGGVRLRRRARRSCGTPARHCRCCAAPVG